MLFQKRVVDTIFNIYVFIAENDSKILAGTITDGIVGTISEDLESVITSIKTEVIDGQIIWY